MHTASFVARETGYAMHGWGHGDRVTNEAFAPLDTFAERFDELLAHVRYLSTYLRDGLAEFGEVRGLGLLLAVELDRPAAPVVEAALANGLVIGSAGENVLRLTPPLTLSLDDAALDEAIRKKLAEQFKYTNRFQVPVIEKVVLNMGIGEGVNDRKKVDMAAADLGLIAGQKAVVTHARKSIATFKLRENQPIGCKVTLRRTRMYEFLDRLVNIALPRVRDFKGVSPRGFDGRGNYTLGLRDQLLFPEIDYMKVDKARGMNVSFVTTAKTDEEGRKLLQLMGMPFRTT